MSFGSTFVCLLMLGLATANSPYRGRFNEPKCRDSQTGRELYIGDAFTRRGHCVRVQCLNNLELWENSCQIPEKCVRLPVANEFLDYPQCCPMYECKTFKSNENGQSIETRTYNYYGNLLKTDIVDDLIEGYKTQPGQEREDQTRPHSRFNV